MSAAGGRDAAPCLRRGPTRPQAHPSRTSRRPLPFPCRPERLACGASLQVADLVGGCNAADEAAVKLVRAAEQRWLDTAPGRQYVDDITAVVVKLQHD